VGYLKHHPALDRVTFWRTKNGRARNRAAHCSGSGLPGDMREPRVGVGRFLSGTTHVVAFDKARKARA